MKQNETQPNQRAGSGLSVRLSVRIQDKVTSLTIKKNIIALWILFCTDGIMDSTNQNANKYVKPGK